MIEVSNIRIPLEKVHARKTPELELCKREALRRLRVGPDALGSFSLHRRSIDSRQKKHIVLTYTVRLELKQGSAAEQDLVGSLAQKKVRNVRLVTEPAYQLPARMAHKPVERPIVVGAGCAGLFCALALAHAGLEPLLIERGDDAARRTEAIRSFDAGGPLDPESNIQFGLGGAGTFSDGKLATGTKSPAHRLILRTFVDAGAPESILWDAKPHVGSDVLPRVVTNICTQIRELGGEVWLRSRLTDIRLSRGRVTGIEVEHTDPSTGTHSTERLSATTVVLSCGHSARDVFELLKARGVLLERKTFAMGVRIEHLQASIDRELYGPSAGDPLLGAAPYKLVAHLPTGRSAFSFCMCPGGYVVAAASEPEGVVTNGMSLSGRDGTNANSGLLANVFPSDLPGDDALAGVALQRRCEHLAFVQAGGDYRAPAQLVGDFLQGRPSSAPGAVAPTYPRGVAWGSVEGCLPPYVVGTLKAALPKMDRRLHGFDASDAVLTGVETRSSSPVRVTRDGSGQSVSTPGLWPCGEGAGYAGGIMSAATDGLRCAQAIITALAL